MTLDVNLETARGQYVFVTEAAAVGVFGPSGAGKTTLLHAIAGLERARGRITIDGDALLDSARGIEPAPERRRVGIVFQDDRLFPHRSVRANLEYGRPRPARQSFDDVVDLLEIAPLLDRRPRSLSGGESRRVALARSVLAEPRLLLLDEPLVSLDAQQRAHVLTLLERLDATLAIPTLHVSHDASELARRVRELVLVDGGRTIAHGTLPELAGHAGAWPRLRALGAVNAIPATVGAHDAKAGLTRYDLGPAASLLGPIDTTRATGTRRILMIGSHDIAISRTVIADISIRNQLPGEIRAIHHHDDHAMVELDLGATVVAEVSHQTAATMRLERGTRVNCLIKSNAVRPA